MSEFNNLNEFRNKFNEIINIVIENYPDEEKTNKLKVFRDTIKDEDLELHANKFCKNIEKNFKKQFLTRNERIFSEKNNIKLVPSINLKSFILSLNEEKKKYLWECIQLSYAVFRSGNEEHKEFINSIVATVEKENFKGPSKDNKKIEQNPFEDAFNGETNKKDKVDNLILDIASSIKKNLIETSNSDGSVDPFKNILQTSEMINKKYANEINSGDINMNDMFSSLGRVMDKISKDANEDEDLKNINISDMKDNDDLMKKFSEDTGMPNPMDVLGEVSGDKDGNPLDLIGKLFNKNKKEENKELTPEQIQEMEEFYANVGTNDLIETEEKEVEIKKSMLGDVANMATGALGIGKKKKSDNEESNDNPMANIMSGLMGGNSEDGENPMANIMSNLLNGLKEGGEDEGEDMGELKNMTKELFGKLGDLQNIEDPEEMNEKLKDFNNDLLSKMPEESREQIKKMTENLEVPLD